MSRQLRSVAFALSLPAASAVVETDTEATTLSKGAPGSSDAGKSSQGQQYVSKYASAYQKYLTHNAGKENHDTDGDKAGANAYQQYVDKYASKYEKYMKGANSSSHADVDQYYKGHSSDTHGAGSYQKYYQKYMHYKTGADTESLATQDINADKDGASAYQQYVDKYASKYEKYMKGANQSSKAYVDQYYKSHSSDSKGEGDYQKYYQQYLHYQKDAEAQSLAAQTDNVTVPATAADCKTEDELNQWMDVNTAKITSNVPADYRHFALAPLEDAYDQQLASLRGKPQPAAAPYSAADCHTKAELDAWKDAQIKSLEKFVPKAYQHFPLDMVNKQYEEQLKKMKAAAVDAKKAEVAKSEATTEKPAATENLVQPKKTVASPTVKHEQETQKPTSATSAHEKEVTVDDEVADVKTNPAPDTSAVSTVEESQNAKVVTDAKAPEALAAVVPVSSSTAFIAMSSAVVAATLSALYRYTTRRRVSDAAKEAPFLRMAASV